MKYAFRNRISRANIDLTRSETELCSYSLANTNITCAVTRNVNRKKIKCIFLKYDFLVEEISLI